MGVFQNWRVSVLDMLFICNISLPSCRVNGNAPSENEQEVSGACSYLLTLFCLCIDNGDANQISSCFNAKKNQNIFSGSFSLHPTLGVFSVYKIYYFSPLQLVAISLTLFTTPYPFLSFFLLFSFFFLLLLLSFWKSSPRNCRCNAPSASLEVIMRSVCFCEDNRESQGILSYFPAGGMGGAEGLESMFVCIGADGGEAQFGGMK